MRCYLDFDSKNITKNPDCSVTPQTKNGQGVQLPTVGSLGWVFIPFSCSWELCLLLNCHPGAVELLVGAQLNPR